MIDEFSFKGRSCWSSWGPGEFFGFAKQGETVCAVIRNESDNSVHMLDIFRGDLRIDEAGVTHPPIEVITIKTRVDGDSDIYFKVCSFENSGEWVKIVWIDTDGAVREKQYNAKAIESIDITYKQYKEDTNETL